MQGNEGINGTDKGRVMGVGRICSMYNIHLNENIFM